MHLIHDALGIREIDLYPCGCLLLLVLVGSTMEEVESLSLARRGSLGLLLFGKDCVLGVHGL